MDSIRAPLHEAIRSNDIDAAKRAIDAGAVVEPEHIACAFLRHRQYHYYDDDSDHRFIDESSELYSWMSLLMQRASDTTIVRCSCQLSNRDTAYSDYSSSGGYEDFFSVIRSARYRLASRLIEVAGMVGTIRRLHDAGFPSPFTRKNLEPWAKSFILYCAILSKNFDFCEKVLKSNVDSVEIWPEHLFLVLSKVFEAEPKARVDAHPFGT